MGYEKIDGIQVIIKIEKSQLNRLNRIAKRYGTTRVSVMRMTMDIGLEAIETFQGVTNGNLEDHYRRAHGAIKKDVAPMLFELEKRKDGK